MDVSFAINHLITALNEYYTAINSYSIAQIEELKQKAMYSVV
jgi:hypothetical protein